MAEELEEVKEKHRKELQETRGMSTGYYQEGMKPEIDRLVGEINPERFAEHAEKALNPEDSLEENIVNLADYVNKKFAFKGLNKIEREEEKYDIEKNLEDKKMDCNVGAALLSGMAKSAGIPSEIKRIKGKDHPKVVLRLNERNPKNDPEIDFYRGRYHVRTKNGVWQIYSSKYIDFSDHYGKKTGSPPASEKLTELEQIIESKKREYDST